MQCCNRNNTGGAIGMSSEERLAAVPFCKAELASCNAGSVNFCFSPIADKIKIPKYIGKFLL